MGEIYCGHIMAHVFWYGKDWIAIYLRQQVFMLEIDPDTPLLIDRVQKGGWGLRGGGMAY